MDKRVWARLRLWVPQSSRFLTLTLTLSPLAPSAPLRPLAIGSAKEPREAVKENPLDPQTERMDPLASI